MADAIYPLAHQTTDGVQNAGTTTVKVSKAHDDTVKASFAPARYRYSSGVRGRDRHH